MLVKIAEIKVGEDRRGIDESNVLNLVKSISEVGLLNPITITKDKKLIAGAHRIEAYKRIGLTEIECTVAEIDGLKAELAEIDENLIRHNLNHIDEGEQLLRKKEIYEILYPETKKNAVFKGNQHMRPNDAGAVGQKKSFVDDTAEKMQVAPRTVQKKIQAARDLTPEVKSIVKERGISEKNSLKLARIKEPEKQKEAAVKLAAGEPIDGTFVFHKPSPEEFKRIHKETVAQLKSEDTCITAESFIIEYEGFAEETVHKCKSYELYGEIYSLLDDDGRKKVAALNTAMLKAIETIDKFQKGNKP